jgi:hypothetical protein
MLRSDLTSSDKKGLNSMMIAEDLLRWELISSDKKGFNSMMLTEALT